MKLLKYKRKVLIASFICPNKIQFRLVGIYTDFSEWKPVTSRFGIDTISILDLVRLQPCLAASPPTTPGRVHEALAREVAVIEASEQPRHRALQRAQLGTLGLSWERLSIGQPHH